MKISSIELKNNGYVYCKSTFYSAQNVLSNDICYTFSQGSNRLIGEIDCGNWAASYLLSMYKYKQEDFILFERPKVIVNNESVSLCTFSKYSCYMDGLNPLFSEQKCPVENLIKQGLEYSKSNLLCSDVKDMFCLDSERVKRSVLSIGNEMYRAFAAIGFSYGKEVFCFPWMSCRRFENYHANLTTLIEILESLNKIIIIPIGN